MRWIVDGIKRKPHPEEPAQRASRRTHSLDPAVRPTGSDGGTLMPHSTEMITVAGATVRLLRAGPVGAGAPPLVFLHGAGGHTGWMAFLEDLSERFAVFSPEHPGFGQSDDPPWLDGAGDLAHFYSDSWKPLALERVHLIGTSLGGWIAAELAVRSTARLASLTLVGAVGITAGGEPTDDIFRMA